MADTAELSQVINLPMSWREFHLAILIFDRFAAERNGDLGHALAVSLMIDTYIEEYFDATKINVLLEKISTLHDATCGRKEHKDDLGL